jgi:hypothetical protein
MSDTTGIPPQAGEAKQPGRNINIIFLHSVFLFFAFMKAQLV